MKVLSEQIKFIDTHCHFDLSPFYENEQESLEKAFEVGVEKIIVPAVEKENFFNVLNLADRYEPLYAAIGLHPFTQHRHRENDLLLLEQILKKRPKKLVAVGEIGLDAMLEDADFEHQKYFLDAQLALARDYDMPVILHSRRTHDILLKHLRRANLSRCGVVHGFSGSIEQAKNFVNVGYAIGVGGTITYPRAKKTRSSIAKLPLDALLLETDAPDMPLNGYQGQPNRPERIRFVWEALCKLRDEKPEDIACALVKNAKRIFEI